MNETQVFQSIEIYFGYMKSFWYVSIPLTLLALWFLIRIIFVDEFD